MNWIPNRTIGSIIQASSLAEAVPGATPICCIIEPMSKTPQCSAIIPSSVNLHTSDA